MKVILYMAMTVNGFIATENDETPWSDETWKNYFEIVKKSGSMIIGNKTYNMIKDSAEREKLGNPLVVVLTTRQQVSNNNVHFAKSPSEALEIINRNEMNGVVIGGGSKTNAAFARENLIDEIILDVEPQIFGQGIPLFVSSDFKLELKLLETRKISENLIQLHYSVIK